MKFKIGLLLIGVVLLTCFTLNGYSDSTQAYRGPVTLTGYVKDSNGGGVNDIVVVAYSTTTSNGDGTPAEIAQCTTYYSNGYGYYRITLPNRGYEYGRLAVYADTYKQTDTMGTHIWQENNQYYNDITVAHETGYPTAQYVGLRESYYGLVRPTVEDWPWNLKPIGYPELLGYESCYWGQVGMWSSYFDWSPAYGQLADDPKPMHVVIVTQTEPNFYGKSWDPDNGVIYCLWDDPDNTDTRMIYLDKLQDTNGDPLTEEIVNIDKLLDDYDSTGQDVYIQVESGHVPIETLLPIVMKRFYKDNGVVKHSSIVGVGIDIEWFQDTNPYEDRETVTAREVNHFEKLVKGYNPKFKMFAKHWDLGPEYDGLVLAIPKKDPDDTELSSSVIIIDDSQGFNNFNHQKSEFWDWVDFYSPNPVGFQIGYPRDRWWWEDLTDSDGNGIVVNNSTGLLNYFGTNNSSRNIGFVWVDFSVRYPEISRGVPNGPTAYIHAHEPTGILEKENWVEYKWYDNDDIITYNNNTYKCVHISEYSGPGREPDKAYMWAVWEKQ